MNQLIIFATEKGYIVNDIGEVYYNDRKRKLNTDKNGYLNFTVRFGKLLRRVYVHKLQAYRKFGNKMFKENIEVRHLDGECLNNKHSNILIGTPSDNMQDIPKRKRYNNAVNASLKKRRFSEDEIKNILKDRKKGMTYSEIALKYIGDRKRKSHIHRIVNNNGYKNLI